MAYKNQYNSNYNSRNINSINNVNNHPMINTKKSIYNPDMISQQPQYSVRITSQTPPPPVAPRHDFKSSQIDRYSTHEEIIQYVEPPKKPAVLYNFLNTLTFGLGLSLFLIGLIYLSIYRYEYSLTVLSIDLIAGFFLAIGIILMALTSIRIILIKNLEIQVILALVISVVLMAFFVLLLVLGSVGLSMKDNDQLVNEARSNFQSTARAYDESSTFKHETKKINYIQMRFNCCGVDSYSDWKAFQSYRNPNQPVKYVDKINYENTFAYRDDVPDSCCINHTPNCGKTTYVFHRDRASVIYTRGCLPIYLRYFTTDLTYLCALSITVAIVFFASSLTFAFVYMRLKSSIEYDDLKTQNRLLNYN